MAKGNKDVRRGIVLYLDGKEVKNNATAIQAEIKKVRKEIDQATLGSEEYKRAVEKWKTLQGALAEHRNQLKLVEQSHVSLLARVNQMFSKYSIVISSFIASLTGVAMKLNQFRRQAAEKEDSAANLKALTGLDDQSVQWLTQQAETLSTTMEKNGLRIRQSSKEILEAYMLVGSAKPELLKDKEALNAVTIEALRLATAAKMELNDAVNAVTTALNQFSAGSDQAARYVNVLAAGSKFGAANVADQAAAIVKAGVAASSANVSVEQLVGMIEMLGEKGIKAEEAGTALKRFLLKLQTDADDTNPAIVGLETALDNLAKKNLSMGDLQKMFGDRAINVAKILIDNTEKVKEYTAAVTDTNVATEQAAINSETTAAKMAQLRNQLNETGMALAKDLAPIFSKTINWTSKFVQMLPPVVSFLKEYGVELLILVGAYNVLTIKTALATAAQKVWTLAVTAGHAIAGVYRATLLLLHAGWLLVTEGTQAATVAMRAFNIACKGNGLGVIIAGVTTVAIGIYELVRLTKEATSASRVLEKVNKTASDEFAREAGKVDMLNKIIHDNTAKLADRKAALDELHKIVPDYLGELDEEGRLVRDNKQAIDDYLVSLEKQIKLKAAQEELEEQYRNKRKQEKAVRDAEEARSNASRAAAAAQFSAMSQSSGLSTSGTRALNTGLNVSVQNAESRLRQAEEVLAEANDELAKTLGNISALEDELRHSDVAITPATPTAPTNPTAPTTPTKTGKNDPVKKELEAIEAKYAERLNALKEKYRQGDIKSEQEYNQLVEDLELERLEESLKIAGLEPKQRAELQAKVLDNYLQTKKKLDAVLNNNETANLSSYKKQLKELEIKEKEERATVGRAHSLGLLNEEVYQKTLADIQQKYQKQREKALENSEEHKRWMEILKKNILSAEAFQKEHNGEMFSFFFRLRKEINDAEMKKLELDKNSEAYKQNEEYLDALIKLYNDKGKVITDLALSIGESLGNALADGINGEWKDVQSAFKSMLVMVLDAIEKMIEASMLVPTLQMLTGVGAGKAWASLAKLAAVKIAFAALKQSVQYYDTGGFTGDGRWDEPRGIVHAGEFVANRYAVANAAVRPVLDLLDQAQRAGTIRNLTAEDIAAVAGHGSNPSASSTSRKSAAMSPISATDPETKRLLRECIVTMRRVKERFDLPIIAETYATGRGGVNEAQELVKKMNNNASRKRK
ncbi:MAG: phage tail tape measure protein [Bacteroidaceae bacterium]|nr:phage tail tape measure protein [Bacteroidaceae bacterium]